MKDRFFATNNLPYKLDYRKDLPYKDIFPPKLVPLDKAFEQRLKLIVIKDVND